MTLSYESVLRAMLMKTYYEKKIDSIDDVLASEREVITYGGSSIPDIMASDPRPKVRDLARRAKTYKPDFSQQEFGYNWIGQGYLLII